MVLACLASAAYGQQVKIIDAYPNIRFNGAIDFQYADDGTDTVYVAERGGTIKKFRNSSLETEAITFLDITDRVSFTSPGEGGLLGVTFHPDFSSNGFFYVYYTKESPPDSLTSVLSRFELDALNSSVADPSSEHVLLELPQPYLNHNGGQIRFGPDGYLYVALGDGGSGGDPEENGQDPTTLFGNILRIDVDNTDPGLEYAIPGDNPFVGNTDGWREEIFAYGFRNPWRFSFDSQTGDLWVGDVGQGSWEEIDIVESGKNYGWDIMEGNHCFEPSSGCDQMGLELPVYEYENDGENRSVTGGFVYRGTKLIDLQGRYVYGDFGSGRVWSFAWDGNTADDNQQIGQLDLFTLSAFGEDRDGELYVLRLGFQQPIYKLVPDEVDQVEIPGTANEDGWRFLGTPKTDQTYQNLLSPVWTQGATGASVVNGDPTVYTYNESTQEFEPVPDLTQIIPNGQGFIAYLFEDDDPTTAGLQGNWPKTLSSAGTEQSGPVDFSISYTSGPDTTLDGFNLVANPYPVSIDWDDATGWTKTNMNNAIYIWDPNANGGNGAYKQWVEGVGDSIAVMAPFQAFFVQVSDTGAALSVNEDAQRSGGEFLKAPQSHQDPIVITINASKGVLEDRMYVYFHPDGKAEVDGYDALQLESYSSTWFDFYSYSSEGVPLAIQSLFSGSDDVSELSVDFGSSEPGQVELSWTQPESLPGQWEVSLEDRQAGQVLDLNQAGSYRFNLQGSAQKAVVERAASPGGEMRAKTVSTDNGESRFLLLVDPDPDDEVAQTEEPEELELDQNFPNPFNPGTIIRYGVPEQGRVQLRVYDVLGRWVATVVDGDRSPGWYEVEFNASQFSSGVYIYQLRNGSKVLDRTMTLIK